MRKYGILYLPVLIVSLTIVVATTGAMIVILATVGTLATAAK